MNARYAFALGCLCMLCSCGSTGQESVAISFSLSGTELTGPIDSAGNVPVALNRADLAFGPLYLCAGTTSGELCETARLEWLDTAVVDALDGRPHHAGYLTGVTGVVQSWMYDLSISSQLAQKQPFILDAAKSLGNASLVLEGSADVDGTIIPFSAAVPILQGQDTEQGIPVVRKSQSDEFFHDVTGDDETLLLQFDARPWISGVDFRSYLQDTTCEPNGASKVCQGQIEQSCDEDGSLVSERTCSALKLVCIRDQGCMETLLIREDDAAYRAIVNGVVAGERPRFQWAAAH